jgi:hypothetical protein
MFCPADQHALRDDQVHWDNSPPSAGNKAAKARLIKIIAALTAYVPMMVLILVPDSTLPEAISLPCKIIEYPALSSLSAVATFHPARLTLYLIALGLLFAWSSVLAWLAWRMAGTFQGEDEPDVTRGQYDWAGFRVRFVIGFILGFLSGWRVVRNSQSMKTLFIASMVGGLVGGICYGAAPPPDFWSRT